MSSEKSTTSKRRRYELRKRADAMADTRRRITEAAMELHGTIGPARTTITAVAERAGVQRPTVYRHFATEADLFAACSGHFWAAHALPDLRSWSAIADPSERLAHALDELYAHYEPTEGIYANVLRDEELDPVVRATLAPFKAFLDEAGGVLAAGWPAPTSGRHMVAAAARHVVDFHTWRSLARRGGLDRGQAVDLAAAMVEHAAAGRHVAVVPSTG
jgi:AcrR family transcriptional regulator